MQSGFHQISRLFLGHASDVYDALWSAYIQQTTEKKDEAVARAIQVMLQDQGMDSQEMQENRVRGMKISENRRKGNVCSVRSVKMKR